MIEIKPEKMNHLIEIPVMEITFKISVNPRFHSMFMKTTHDYIIIIMDYLISTKMTITENWMLVFGLMKTIPTTHLIFSLTKLVI